MFGKHWPDENGVERFQAVWFLSQCNDVSLGVDQSDDKSLMVLERVISTLASKASVPDSRVTVPYKDSVSSMHCIIAA